MELFQINFFPIAGILPPLLFNKPFADDYTLCPKGVVLTIRYFATTFFSQIPMQQLLAYVLVTCVAV